MDLIWPYTVRNVEGRTQKGHYYFHLTPLSSTRTEKYFSSQNVSSTLVLNSMSPSGFNCTYTHFFTYILRIESINFIPCQYKLYSFKTRKCVAITQSVCFFISFDLNNLYGIFWAFLKTRSENRLEEWFYNVTAALLLLMIELDRLPNYLCVAVSTPSEL